MLLHENIPQKYIDDFKNKYNEDTVTYFRVDLDIFGNIKDQYAVFSKKRAVLYEKTDGKSAVILKEHKLIPESSFKIADKQNNIFIEIIENKKEIRFARMSKSHLDAAKNFIGIINNVLKGKEPTQGLSDKVAFRCIKCGREIPTHNRYCRTCIKKQGLLKRLSKYAKPYTKQWILINIFIYISTAASMLIPYMTKRMIDINIPKKDISGLALSVSIFLVLHVGIAALNVLKGIVSSKTTTGIEYIIRKDLFEAIKAQDLKFHHKESSGKLLSRVMHDTQDLQGLIYWSLIDFMPRILTMLAALTIMFIHNWKLALIAAVPAPIIISLFKRCWSKFRLRWAPLRAARDYLHNILNDIFSGIQVVKAFGSEEKETGRFKTGNSNNRDRTIDLHKTDSFVFPVMGIIYSLGNIAVWVIGAAMTANGELTIGGLIMFTGYLSQFYGPLGFLSWLPRWVSSVMNSTSRIFSILDLSPEIIDDKDAVDMPDIEGNITFKNVTFGYDKYEPVLKNISIDIKKGEMIGLIGESGAGKSTFINLVCRFYDVDEGSIEIDKTNVKKIKLSSLKKQMGVVMQDSFLFNGTVYDNIAYGNPDVSAEDVIRAAKAANAHEFIIDFPQGYNYILQEGGKNISGGQKQRLCIARAILMNPKILILDEATSNVDTKTEVKIQEAMDRLIEGRTTIAIAHRLSTLRKADRLMVIEKGVNIETGTHEELMKKKGKFYELINLQKKLSEIKAVGG